MLTIADLLPALSGVPDALKPPAQGVVRALVGLANAVERHGRRPCPEAVVRAAERVNRARTRFDGAQAASMQRAATRRKGGARGAAR